MCGIVMQPHISSDQCCMWHCECTIWSGILLQCPYFAVSIVSMQSGLLVTILHLPHLKKQVQILYSPSFASILPSLCLHFTFLPFLDSILTLFCLYLATSSSSLRAEQRVRFPRRRLKFWMRQNYRTTSTSTCWTGLPSTCSQWDWDQPSICGVRAPVRWGCVWSIVVGMVHHPMDYNFVHSMSMVRTSEQLCINRSFAKLTVYYHNTVYMQSISSPIPEAQFIHTLCSMGYYGTRRTLSFFLVTIRFTVNVNSAQMLNELIA